MCYHKPGEKLKQAKKPFMLKWKRHLYVSSFLNYLGITLSHFLDHSIVSGPMNLLFMGS